MIRMIEEHTVREEYLTNLWSRVCTVRIVVYRGNITIRDRVSLAEV